MAWDRGGSALLCLAPAHGSLSGFQKQKDRKKREKLGQELKSKKEAELVSDCADASPQTLPGCGCRSSLQGSCMSLKVGRCGERGGQAEPRCPRLLSYSCSLLPEHLIPEQPCRR